MESIPDSVALAQQVQALPATIEELTRQNQEMKLRLQQIQQAQQESKGNPDEEGESHRRSFHQRPATLDEQNSELLREVRREMDELRNALKEKTDRSVDKMVRATDSPFTSAVLNVLPCRQSFGTMIDGTLHSVAYYLQPISFVLIKTYWLYLLYP